jgi:hypothetical protein
MANEEEGPNTNLLREKAAFLRKLEGGVHLEVRKTLHGHLSKGKIKEFIPKINYSSQFIGLVRRFAFIGFRLSRWQNDHLGWAKSIQSLNSTLIYS